MSRESELLTALMRFEKRIAINAIGVSPNILSKAIAMDVRIAYYLTQISTSVEYGSVPRYIFNVEYKDTDLPLSDIYVVSSGAEVHSILCRYIGGYKTRLVIFAPSGIDVGLEYNKFSTVNAPFYSNYMGAKLTTGSFSNVSMTYYYFYFDYRIGKVKLMMMEKGNICP